MVDVFISYSRSDLAAVTRLAEAVEAEGYDVWWDADLPPHLSYGDVITAKIGMAKAAIVVWSKESAASEWVRAEADMARNQKKLVQTAIDNIMPPLPFNQIQYAEIGDWRGEPDHPAWRKVKVSLAELCGRPKRAKPAAAARQPASPPNVPPTPPLTPLEPPKTPPGLLYGGIGVFALVVAIGIGTQLGGGTPNPAGDAAGADQAAALAGPDPASVATSAPVADSGTKDRRVMIMNMSSQPLLQLYASPVTSDNWEEDLLGSGVLAAGASINANIDNGTSECSFDLKAVMADGQEHIQRAVNVCAISQWTIGDSGNSTG